jgi:hypothetical protein
VKKIYQYALASIALIGCQAEVVGLDPPGMLEAENRPPAPEAEGRLLWTRIFDASGSDVPKAITFNNAGNIIGLGHTEQEGSCSSSNLWIASYRSDGEPQWIKILSDLTPEQSRATCGAARDVATDGDDNIFVLAALPASSVDGIVLLKLDPQGRVLWAQVIPGKSADKIVVDQTGAVIIAGFTYEAAVGAAWIGKFDGAGRLLWEDTDDTKESTSFHDTRLNTDGNIWALMSGYESGRPFVAMLNYNRPGIRQSKTALDPSACGTRFNLGPEGDFVFVKSGSRNRERVVICRFGTDLSLTWRIAEASNDEQALIVQEMVIDRWGNIILSGIYAPGSNPTLQTAFLRKYNPEAELLWENSYQGPNEEFAYNHGLSVDNAGNIVVVDMIIQGQDSGIAVRKFSP